MSEPVQKYREGVTSAAIFEREIQGSKGPFISQSVALQQSYQKDGQWQNRSLTIIKKNLANTIEVLRQARAYLEGDAVSEPSDTSLDMSFLELQTLKTKPLSELSDREIQFLEEIGSCD